MKLSCGAMRSWPRLATASVVEFREFDIGSTERRSVSVIHEFQTVSHGVRHPRVGGF